MRFPSSDRGTFLRSIPLVIFLICLSNSLLMFSLQDYILGDQPASSSTVVEILPRLLNVKQEKKLPLNNTSMQAPVENNNSNNIPRTMETPNQQQSQNASLFAYAFVISGCDPSRPLSYRNYLFNIAVATRNLRERGSRAHVVALLQVHPFQNQYSKTTSNHSDSNTERPFLPEFDWNLLRRLGIHVYSIPAATRPSNFYKAQLDKFRILGLTQYERVLFLDGDVMPLDNLDYLMEMSWNNELQENVVIQGLNEPANGGFFVLKPGFLHEVQDSIVRREQMANQRPYPHFDERLGWGHEPLKDPWVAGKSQGTNWTFLAAYADQGLLYYYTKYSRKSVSIVMRNGQVQNWGTTDSSDADNNSTDVNSIVSTNNKVRLMETLDNPFRNVNNSQRLVGLPGRHNYFQQPINSYVHFTGRNKPWMGGTVDCCHNVTHCCNETAQQKLQSPKHYWYYTLAQILRMDKDASFNFTQHWQESETVFPPLGLAPFRQQARHAETDITTPLTKVA